jgi:hypothetical protein
VILFGWPKIVEFGFSDVEYVLEKLKEWRLRKRRKKIWGGRRTEERREKRKIKRKEKNNKNNDVAELNYFLLFLNDDVSNFRLPRKQFLTELTLGVKLITA